MLTVRIQLRRFVVDGLIRETQTDSPGFGPSYVVRPSAGGLRPACRAALASRHTKLNMQAQALLGRKGPYAVFEATDAPDAEPFTIWRLSDGQKLYSDQKSLSATTTSAAGIEAVGLEGDTLRLRYLRYYDARCSLLTEGAACWARAMREGHFANVVTTQAPPIANCRSVYATAGVAAGFTSAIVYVVEITVTIAGKVTVLSRGPIGCLPAGG